MPSPLAAIRLVFAINALGIALWFPRIPDVKAALEVDLFHLSLCFLMLPMGTLAGFFVAPAIVGRAGSRAVCRWGGALFVLMFLGPALAPTASALALALLAAGLTVAPVEVAMNTKAVDVELAGGRRIMASCHGFWSLGSMAGALLGGAAAAMDIGFATQQLVLAPLFAALAWWIAGPLPDDRTAPDTDRRLRLPKGALLAVCLMPLGALMAEGAMMEWSALFLRESVGTGALAAAAVYAVFSLAMAAGRLAGDRLIESLGARSVLAVSAALAGVSMAAFALAPGLSVALPAALALGLGAANIYPLAMSRAAELPGSAGANIATVAVCGFSVFLVSPPLIGLVGSVFGLPTALFLLAPIAATPLLLLAASLATPATPEPAP